MTTPVTARRRGSPPRRGRGPGHRALHAAHLHREFLRFLNAIEAAVPAGQAVPVILDNDRTHRHPTSGHGSGTTRASCSTSRRARARGSTPLRPSSPRLTRRRLRLRRGSFAWCSSCGRRSTGSSPRPVATPEPSVWIADPHGIPDRVRGAQRPFATRTATGSSSRRWGPTACNPELSSDSGEAERVDDRARRQHDPKDDSTPRQEGCAACDAWRTAR